MADYETSSYETLLENLEEKEEEFEEGSDGQIACNLGYRMVEKILGNNYGSLKREREILEDYLMGTSEDEDEIGIGDIEEAIDYENVKKIGNEEIENDTDMTDYEDFREGILKSSTISGYPNLDEEYREVVNVFTEDAKQNGLSSAIKNVDKSINSILSELTKDGNLTADTVIENIRDMDINEFESTYVNAVGASFFNYALNKELARVNKENGGILGSSTSSGSGKRDRSDKRTRRNINQWLQENAFRDEAMAEELGSGDDVVSGLASGDIEYNFDEIETEF